MTAEPAPGLTAHGTLNQVERLFLVPRRDPSQGVVQRLALPNMPQDLRDQRWVLDTGNHPQRAAAMGTGLDVDGKDKYIMVLISIYYLRYSVAPITTK